MENGDLEYQELLRIRAEEIAKKDLPIVTFRLVQELSRRVNIVIVQTNRNRRDIMWMKRIGYGIIGAIGAVWGALLKIWK